MDELKETTQRKASFGKTMKAVFWSFFGIRKKSDYEKDAQQLNPVHVIIAGLIGAIIFIVTLLLIVKSVVGK
ncbi:MAG TPA: DUF2970 domain-containing protein [Noviherbaspirillum sp.]|uniref:DUF2970 domain-containing protein n=1 Tax=Noviherbaspirillum sp. TaxID=1926288 RepID=UPI002B47C85F|nr:DUF2970 domain-containing protein [Noviherbaspirillum sp.]HJV87947.1 DUF2970 domain-containing protein [Noviherbaspirillum sp.]